ncbi:asynaptic protein [Tasmannia lanceolata]|uniref:asynaptic protein n=1 Tax=Tasmannia lanceolata TaxID=3420 RepID=UPI004062E591
MELVARRNIGYDQPADCQSFGSDYFPSGQSRKISIGVTVEPSAKTRPADRKGDEAKKVASCEGKFTEENGELGKKVAFTGKKAEAANQGTTRWLSTRSLHQETATTKTIQFYANQTSILHGDDGIQKKFDSITYGKKREKDGNTERVEEFAFATKQQMHVLNGTDGEKPEKKTKESSEALRIKLWEILGTGPSQNADLQDQQTDTKNSKPERNMAEKGKTIKHKQNSDTIETDSEIPYQTISRPVTRSRTRKAAPASRTQKKAPAKMQKRLKTDINNGGRFLPSRSSSLELKCQEDNVFAFDEAEGKAGTLHWPVNGRNSMCKRKKRSTKIEPRKISFPRKGTSEKSLKATEREKTPPTPEKTSSQSTRIESFHNPPYQSNKNPLQPKAAFIEEKSRHFPVKQKNDPLEDLNSPPSPKNADPQEYFDNPQLQKNTEPQEDFASTPSPKNAGLQESGGSPLPENASQQDDFHSPTFAAYTTTKNDSPSTPLPQDTPVEEFRIPAPSEKRFMVEKFSGLRDLRTSRLGSSGSDTHTESSDDTRELKDSPTLGSSPVMEEKDADKQLSLSSMEEEQDCDSMDGNKLIDEGFRTKAKWSSLTASPDKPPFMLRRSNRLHTPSPSPKGTEESNGSQGASAQTQENSLSRAITQFALVLERFKTKMNSQTSKRSAEILAAVADKIRLQLQGVESQIQTDVAKFTSNGKSKRKRLESKFQEQQERLKLLHDKFKEELNQSLQDCRSVLEEVEAYHIELKGTSERQKASHRKLLLQVEEGIQTQLGDAERSITAIHKAATKRMQGLKHVLRECLS